jgi:hypothetical protein
MGSRRSNVTNLTVRHRLKALQPARCNQGPAGPGAKLADITDRRLRSDYHFQVIHAPDIYELSAWSVGVLTPGQLNFRAIDIDRWPAQVHHKIASFNAEDRRSLLKRFIQLKYT